MADRLFQNQREDGLRLGGQLVVGESLEPVTGDELGIAHQPRAGEGEQSRVVGATARRIEEQTLEVG